ncbi:hypothetical protein BYT27DRAFT_6901084 [Phlegmacium glaucopus]|nr:hypothetical protein BYT27DRAFT_6901084 [Phlegmacium glaucopus]
MSIPVFRSNFTPRFIMNVNRLISIDQTHRSGRFLLAVHAINYHAFDPDYGVSQTEDEIEHENEIWKKLLDNQFCKDMKDAASDNVQVTKGFKWYMIQDFLYCGKLMVFDTDRSTTAPDKKTYKKLSEQIQTNAQYAITLLDTCADELKIKESLVLHAKREFETEQYTDYTINVAENFDWVTSLVAMIPCIQSYYAIATYLKDNSVHKDTIWYKYWAEPNSNEAARQYTEVQKTFFVANYDAWKDISYGQLRRIFAEACQREIDLWAVGNQPGTVD